jgi:hypothetical protein
MRSARLPVMCGMVAVAGAVSFRAPAAGDRSVSSCNASSAALEHEWGGTGAWRPLSPYPVPREASPTDSVGVWLERRHQPNGSVLLERVSADRTLSASFSDAGCATRVVAPTRTFDSSAVARSFTDADLRTLLRHNARGMIYVWSPGMPLSVRGIAEARAAARMLGIAFTAVAAEATPEALRGLTVSAEDDRAFASLDLVYRNANIHYPTAIFYRDGTLSESAIPGYKRRDTYAMLGREALAGAEPARAPTAHTPAFWVDHAAKVSSVSSVQTVRPVGFFFKPVPGTSLVTYTSQNASYIFDLATRREQRIPGNVDPVPTPDGRFVTRPGLMFYPTALLAAGDTTAVFVDPDLPDEYQTVSILEQTRDVVRYHIVTGWRVGVRVRDYDVSLDRSGKPQRITPVGPTSVPCPDERFTLPISAKNSREIGVFDTKTKTNRIVEVTEDGRCVEQLNLGFASGKLSFNYDGSVVGFATSRIDIDAEGALLKPDELFYKDALLLYRKTGRLVSLSKNRPLSGMTFPEFLPDGRSMILDQASRFRPVELIRVVEVK